MSAHEREPADDGLTDDQRELVDLWLTQLSPGRSVAHAPPITQVERDLASIWKDALQVERVGLDDDWFALGGDSIVAIIVVAKAQEAGVPFSIQELFDAHTIRALVRGLEARAPRTQLKDEQRAEPDDEAPLGITPLQTGMLFHALSDPRTYVVQASCLLTGDIDLEQLAEAWQDVVDDRPELRRFFDLAPGGPVQLTAPRMQLDVVTHDWRQFSAEERADLLARHQASDRERGIDPMSAPLLRVALAQESDRSCRCLLTHHHLLLDGWSQQLIIDDVLDAYQRLSESEPAERPQRSAPRTAAYLDWLARQDLAEAETFWRAELAGFTPRPTTLPWTSTVDGTTYDVVDLVLDRAISQDLDRFARQQALTLTSIITGGWVLLVSLMSGADDVAVGLTVSGRPADLPGATEAIGMFINTLPLRVRVDPGLGPVQWLRGIQQQATEAQRRHFTPLSLVERCVGAAAGTRLFESIVVAENFPHHQQNDARPRLRVTEQDSAIEEGYPLVLEIRPGQTIRLRIRFDTQRVPASQASGLIHALAAYAGALPASIENDVGRLQHEIASILARSTQAARQQRRHDAAGYLRSARRQPADGGGES